MDRQMSGGGGIVVGTQLLSDHFISVLITTLPQNVIFHRD